MEMDSCACLLPSLHAYHTSLEWTSLSSVCLLLLTATRRVYPLFFSPKKKVLPISMFGINNHLLRIHSLSLKTFFNTNRFSVNDCPSALLSWMSLWKILEAERYTLFAHDTTAAISTLPKCLAYHFLPPSRIARSLETLSLIRQIDCWQFSPQQIVNTKKEWIGCGFEYISMTESLIPRRRVCFAMSSENPVWKAPPPTIYSILANRTASTLSGQILDLTCLVSSSVDCVPGDKRRIKDMKLIIEPIATSKTSKHRAFKLSSGARWIPTDQEKAQMWVTFRNRREVFFYQHTLLPFDKLPSNIDRTLVKRISQ